MSNFFERLRPYEETLRQQLLEALPKQFHRALTDPSYANYLLSSGDLTYEDASVLMYPMLTMSCLHLFTEYSDPVVPVADGQMSATLESKDELQVFPKSLSDRLAVAYYKFDNASDLKLYRFGDMHVHLPMLLNKKPTKESHRILMKMQESPDSLTSSERQFLEDSRIPDDELRRMTVYAEGIFIVAQREGMFGMLCPKVFGGIQQLELPAQFQLAFDDSQTLVQSAEKTTSEIHSQEVEMEFLPDAIIDAVNFSAAMLSFGLLDSTRQKVIDA